MVYDSSLKWLVSHYFYWNGTRKEKRERERNCLGFNSACYQKSTAQLKQHWIENKKRNEIKNLAGGWQHSTEASSCEQRKLEYDWHVKEKMINRRHLTKQIIRNLCYKSKRNKKVQKQIDFQSMKWLTLISKSSKLANDDDPKASAFGPWAGRGGAGLGGGCLAFFGGNAGEGDSGACDGLDPCVGAWRMANGSLPKASLPLCGNDVIEI